MGMCEGGATLQAIMFEQKAGRTNILDGIKFFIHLAPWTTGLAEPQVLDIPTLAISGYYAEYMHSGGRTTTHA